MKQLSTHFLSFILFILFIHPCTVFAQQPPNRTGEIHGTVYRRGSGGRVASAQVRLVETGQHIITDPNGEFRFRNLPAGKYTLTVFASGYRLPADVVVTVKPEETTRLKIYLEPVEFLFDEVRVTAQRLPSTVSRQSLGGLEIKRVPGTAGDALRALQALPGIGVANDFSGSLYIRGGSEEDNLYYFDRVPVGYPYHFGGIVSSLSSEIIERIDVYAGGYGAEFGVDSQAVIDIYSRDKNTDGLHGKFNLNLLYSEGMFEGKIGKRGFWYAAGRRSYLDLFLGSLSFDSGQITAFPRFWDYQLKGGYDLSEKHQLFVNFFASGDRFALKLDGKDVDEDFRGNLSFQSGFEGAGIHLRSLLTDRLTSFLSFTRSDTQFEFNIGSGLFLKVDAPDYVLREDLTYTLMPKHQLESGLILALEPGQVSGNFSRPPQEGEVDYDFRFEEKTRLSEQVQGQRVEVYLQDRYAVLPFLSVVAGLRLDYFNRIDKFSIQPRGSLQLEIPSGVELQLSYGLYHQTPQPWQLSPSIGNPALGASRASHYILELTRQLSPETEIKFAGYYKDLASLVTVDDKASYLNQGVGFAQGTEVFLRHRAGSRFFGWVSYAYALAKRRDRPGAPYRYYSFDQTHVATLVASYNPAPTWEIGVKWQYRTGNPYTPVRGATVQTDPRNGNFIYDPIYEETNSARFPPYHRLDLKFSKAFRFENWQMGVFLELLNAYNRQNLLDFNYSENYKEKDEIYQFPILPYLGITTEF